MKVESAGSKPSKEAVDLAEGPKAGEIIPPQAKSWFSSLWGSSTKKSVDASKPKYPDKVGVSRNYVLTRYPKPLPLHSQATPTSFPGHSHFVPRPLPFQFMITYSIYSIMLLHRIGHGSTCTQFRTYDSVPCAQTVSLPLTEVLYDIRLSVTTSRSWIMIRTLDPKVSSDINLVSCHA